MVSLAYTEKKDALIMQTKEQMHRFYRQISMVIYIFHWIIGVILNPVVNDLEMKQRIIIYYLITFVVAVVMLRVNSVFRKIVRAKA